jgi:antitoxin ParD1/3/4
MHIILPEGPRTESGETGNTSEDVWVPIRKHQREQRIQRLRSLVDDGLTSGKATADKSADWVELAAMARGDIE